MAGCRTHCLAIMVRCWKLSDCHATRARMLKYCQCQSNRLTSKHKLDGVMIEAEALIVGRHLLQPLR